MTTTQREAIADGKIKGNRDFSYFLAKMPELLSL
jgi:hypothetical protein